MNSYFAQIVWSFLIVGVSILFTYCGKAHAEIQDCTLTWDANSEADLMGYHVYAQSKGPGQYVKGEYQADIPAGRQAARCLADMRLSVPGTYFFSLTAYDKRLNESGFSNEVSKLLSDVPAVGAPGLITNFSLVPDNGSILVSMTVPDDGSGKPALIDVRYEEGQTIAWGSATQFACISFPCKIVGLKQGMTYTVQAIPVRRIPGSPSVFGVFTVPLTTKTLTDVTIPPIDPPIDIPPIEPRKLEISVIEKDGLITLSFKKGDLLK